MATNGVKWYGDERLQEIREATPEGLFEGAQMLVEAATARAPRESGDLQKSGYAAMAGKSTYRADKQHRKETKPPQGGAVAGFSVFYAHMVEFGTRSHRVGTGGKVLRLRDGKFVRGPVPHPGMRARPFLRPAIDELQAQIGDAIAVAIGKKLK